MYSQSEGHSKQRKSHLCYEWGFSIWTLLTAWAGKLFVGMGVGLLSCVL